MKNINKFAAFNCQGLNSDIKKMNIADDFIHHNLTAMKIQKTKLKGNNIYSIYATTGEELHLYNSGHDKSTCGAGIIMRKNNIIDFKPISERICKITIEMNDIKCNISAYAPTSERTKKDPEETCKFYELLSVVINKTKTKETIIMGGDFNAKTKLPTKDPILNKIIGKYAKSKVNVNGEKLIEFCSLHNLHISNTFL